MAYASIIPVLLPEDHLFRSKQFIQANEMKFMNLGQEKNTRKP